MIDLKSGIYGTAQRLGMSPLELATIMSYETGGTFDPMQPGPRTKWGQHRGFIQFGEPQAQQYGADFSNPQAALISQLGAGGAVENYFRGSGWKPGMGIMDAYSIVNAGGPGRYGASDTAAGGAPGTVRDKVMNQFGPHYAKAAALLGIDPSQLPDMMGAGTNAMAFSDPNAYTPAVSMPNVTMSTRGATGTPFVKPERQSVIQQLMGGDFKGAAGNILSRDTGGGLPEQVVGNQRRADRLALLAAQTRQGIGSNNAPASWAQVLGSGLADWRSGRAQGAADKAQGAIAEQLTGLIGSGNIDAQTIAQISALNPELGQQLMMGQITAGQRMDEMAQGHQYDLELEGVRQQNEIALAAMEPEDQTALQQNLESAGYTPGTPQYEAAMRQLLAQQEAQLGITGYDAQGRPLIGTTQGGGLPDPNAPVAPTGAPPAPAAPGATATPGPAPTIPGGPAAPVVPGTPAASGGTLIGIDEKTGMTTATNQEGVVTQTPAIGSEIERERAAEEARIAEEEKRNNESSRVVIDAIDEALRLSSVPGAVGFGRNITETFENLPFTPDTMAGSGKAQIDPHLETIKANIAIDKISEMRQNSPTGAAMGNVSDKDMEMLTQSFGALSAATTVEEFRKQASELRARILAVTTGENYEEVMGYPPPNKTGGESQQYETGKVYVDGQGNEAMWDGTKWVEQ